MSLILVHLAVAIHIAHWWIRGKTVTPVEPSEAMQTLGTEALLNAGFVLFALTIVSTFLFGRFFCGWGCHVIAYQDLCTWILKKMGIRPQPFRSRLLVFVPLAAAIFLFVVPSVVRLYAGVPRAEYTTHFTTYDFWDRFPGWFVGSLTILVCGFAIVFLLGNKGFCTYACPYVGFYGLADPFAPGKIRVTDACEQCGHCTAACTSNVRVHEEVNRFGMVRNPGCMKCLDCISVCPKDALYFGFGRPSIATKKRRPKKPARYDFTWPEELALAGIFLVSVVILRKLYDGVPFLLALALASITAYAQLSAARFLYAPNVRFARFLLRSRGRCTRAGYVFATVTAVWAIFLGHSAVVQVLTARGRAALIEARQLTALQDDRMRSAARERLDEGIADLENADALGLVPVANLLFDMSMAYVSRGDFGKAERCLRRAIELWPRFAAARYELVGLLLRDDAHDAAIVELREIVRVAPEFPSAHSDLANLLIERGRSDEAVRLLADLIEQRPDVVEFHLARGLALAHHGALDEAIVVMRETAHRWPSHPDAYFNLGSTLARRGDLEPGLQALQEAVRLNPASGMIHVKIAQVAESMGNASLADEHFRAARDLAPFNPAIVRPWVVAVHRRGTLNQEITKAERAGTRSRAARFRLIYLYGAAGRVEAAQERAAEFLISQDPH